MNGKRQTIWLVSMLSLMVVLSAYYLFTEDSGPKTAVDTAIQAENTTPGAVTVSEEDGIVVNEVVTDGQVVQNAGQETGTAAPNTTDAAGAAGEQMAAGGENQPVDPAAGEKTASADKEAAGKDTAKDNAGKDTAAAQDGKETAAKPEDNAAGGEQTASAKEEPKTGEAAEGQTAAAPESDMAKDDAAVLKEVESQSASYSSMFSDYLLDREQKNLKEQNDLLAAINDMSKTPEDNAAAQEKLRSLEEKESKITGIEEQLQQKYGEAIVKEENGNSYKVVVRSDKLDVKQAVGIVDLVMKELSVAQNQISVQYVSKQ